MGDILGDDFRDGGEYCSIEVSILEINNMHAIDGCSDHGPQRVPALDLEADEEWQEVQEDEEGVIEDDDLEPLPPGRRQRTSETRKERDSSSTTVGGKQVQEKVVSAHGGQSGVILSLEASRDSNHRGSGSEALGGTLVQRQVTCSLGRQSQANFSSGASRDSAPRDKKSCMETAQVAEVPSSPPNVSRGASSPSLNSDGMSGVLEKRASQKYWKKEYVPEHNWVVFELAKNFLQEEVLAQLPWANTATIENLV